MHYSLDLKMDFYVCTIELYGKLREDPPQHTPQMPHDTQRHI